MPKDIKYADTPWLTEERHRCDTCFGQGEVCDGGTSDGPDSWDQCPECDGYGHFLVEVIDYTHPEYIAVLMKDLEELQRRFSTESEEARTLYDCSQAISELSSRIVNQDA